MRPTLLLAVLLLSAGAAQARIVVEDRDTGAEIPVLIGEGVVSTASSGMGDASAAPDAPDAPAPAPEGQGADSCAGGDL